LLFRIGPPGHWSLGDRGDDDVGPTRRLMIGVIVLLSGLAGYAAGRVVFRPVRPVSQPIAFNHLTHVEDLEIECDVCHDLYATSEHSGLPALTTCLGCHEDAQTEQLEEQKVRDLAAAGEDDVFRKLFKLADHAFYSHQRHVTQGEVPCETCHGSIASTTAPPERPLVRITMDFCIECHERRGIESDCTRCHR
jgi:cytochrome c553